LSTTEPEEKKNYMALYRLLRPQLFSEVVGQEHVTRTLQNALERGRVAHAYLFCGLRGTGKTSMAKLLAKALNCQEGVSSEPCNRCRFCLEITQGRSLDVLEIDAASNRGIDEIRDLREKVRYAAARSRYKVYIIDEVHMLTNEAFNALLKTLEEPPSRVVFILATTEPHKLPLTVISRCQRFDFHLLKVQEIAGHLRRVCAQMNFQADEETLFLLARLAEGSMRDALGFLEQCRTFGGDKISYRETLEILGLTGPETIYALLEAVAGENVSAGLILIQEIIRQGRDLHRFIGELILYLRKLVLVQAGGDEEKSLEDVPGMKPYLLKQKDKFNSALLLEMLEILQQLTYQLRGSSQTQFLLELAFLRLIRAFRFRDYLSPSALLSRLEELEEKLALAQRELMEGNPCSTFAAAQAATAQKSAAARTEDPAAHAEKISFFPKDEAKAPLDAAEDDASEKLAGERLQQFWEQQFLPELKRQRKLTIHAYLLESAPQSCEEGIFTISFPSTCSIHKGRIESKENREFLESMLEKMLGRKMRLKVLLQKEGGNLASRGVEKKTAPEAKVLKGKKEDDFFIQQILELFNGRLIETGMETLNFRDFWGFSLNGQKEEQTDDW